MEKQGKWLSRGACAQQAVCAPEGAAYSSHPRPLPLQPDRRVEADLAPSWEARLLHSAAIQRLHALSQLGFVERIWPQASHSRFEHSLGCYQLAQCAVAHLQACSAGQPAPLFSPMQAQTFLVAALLHDVGHYPFSHSLDGLRSLLPSHERVGRALIEQGELATILERDYHLVPAQVADLIDPPLHLEATGSNTLLRQLLNGSCDIDKLDYVARDAQACGFFARVPDPCLLFSALAVHWPDTQAVPRLAFSAPALRHLLYLQVYWHPLNRACSTMLTRAVQDALDTDALTVADLQRVDDATLLARLSTPAMPVETRWLVQMLSAQRLYQPAIEISHRATSLFDRLLKLTQDALRRKWVEQQLARAFTRHLQREVAEYEVLLDLVPPKPWEVDGWIVYQPPVGMAACVPWSHALGIVRRSGARSPPSLSRARSDRSSPDLMVSRARTHARCSQPGTHLIAYAVKFQGCF